MGCFRIEYSWGDRMEWWIVSGVLGAFGIVCLFAVLKGWLFSRHCDGRLVCFGAPEEKTLMAMQLYRLKAMGLLHGRIFVSDERTECSQCPYGAEITDLEDCLRLMNRSETN